MKAQTKTTAPATRVTFTAAEVRKANYLVAPSRTSQFRNAARAYKVNPDGSISTRFDLEYFK